MLYWTDHSLQSPAIYRLSVVSRVQEAVVSDGLVMPTALAIDFTGSIALSVSLINCKDSFRLPLSFLHFCFVFRLTSFSIFRYHHFHRSSLFRSVLQTKMSSVPQILPIIDCPYPISRSTSRTLSSTVFSAR